MNYGLENKTSWYNISKTLQDIITRKISYDDLSTEIKNFIEGGDLNNIDCINTRRKKVLDTLEEHLKELYKLADDGDNAIRQYIDYNVNILKKAIEDLRNSVKKKAEEGANDPPDDTPLKNLLKTDGTEINGSVVKTDPTGPELFLDTNFRELKVVVNDQELQDEMTFKPISLKDVFNSWYRFAHFDPKIVATTLDHSDNYDRGLPSGQNLPQFSRQYVWTYDDSIQTIHQGIDGGPICGFVSPSNYYTNYFLRIKAQCGWDDDNMMLICGYMKDDAGVEHTLMVVRGSGSVGGSGWEGRNPKDGDTIFLWGLIYDMGNPTQKIIVDLSDTVKIQPTYRDNRCACYMTLIRLDSTIVGKTSRYDRYGRDLGDNPAWEFRWEYPSNCPDYLTPTEYYNIGVMLKRTNRVGFGVRSGQPWFKIDKQYNIFDDGDIYALHQDLVYYYDSATEGWKVRGKCSDILPNYIWLYNPRIHNFYFYYKAYQWQKIVLNSSY